MKKNKWQLQEAKNKFSRVAEEAALYGPQIVTKRGADAVVILSIRDYESLRKRTSSIVDFLKHSPLAGTELEIDRSHEPGREISL